MAWSKALDRSRGSHREAPSVGSQHEQGEEGTSKETSTDMRLLEPNGMKEMFMQGGRPMRTSKPK